jgi:hypothetical protein
VANVIVTDFNLPSCPTRGSVPRFVAQSAIGGSLANYIAKLDIPGTVVMR